MDSSDNVIRAGLTPKLIDHGALFETVDFNAHEPLHISPNGAPPGYRCYQPPTPEFQIEIMTDTTRTDNPATRAKSFHDSERRCCSRRSEPPGTTRSARQRLARPSRTQSRPHPAAHHQYHRGPGPTAPSRPVFPSDLTRIINHPISFIAPTHSPQASP